jgi:hypothetical protein
MIFQRIALRDAENAAGTLRTKCQVAPRRVRKSDMMMRLLGRNVRHFSLQAHRGTLGTSSNALRAKRNCSGKVERVKGIEPSYSAWKAAALPFSYTRDIHDLFRRKLSLVSFFASYRSSDLRRILFDHTRPLFAISACRETTDCARHNPALLFEPKVRSEPFDLSPEWRNENETLSF